MITDAYCTTFINVSHVDGNRRTLRGRVSLGDLYCERVARRGFKIKLANIGHSNLSSATNGKGVVRIATGNTKACWAACGH